MKVRIRFSKQGAMKFIGHLDMVRYFQKVFRRANIDIQYSQGFSPHQLMSFASPLGVGLTSTGEYMDIFVGKTYDSQTMIDMINKENVEGVRVLSFKQIEDETKHSNAMSLIAAADYHIEFRDSSIVEDITQESIDSFLNQSTIVVTKKTKKSTTQTDIKPMIYNMNIENGQIYMQIACGSAANLKPELLMNTFFEFLGKSFDEFQMLTERVDMYAFDAKKKQYVSLDDLGIDIREVHE